jgi:hypothetical protein
MNHLHNYIFAAITGLCLISSQARAMESDKTSLERYETEEPIPTTITRSLTEDQLRDPQELAKLEREGFIINRELKTYDITTDISVLLERKAGTLPESVKLKPANLLQRIIERAQKRIPGSYAGHLVDREKGFMIFENSEQDISLDDIEKKAIIAHLYSGH